jgi:hypothetical protein
MLVDAPTLRDLEILSPGASSIGRARSRDDGRCARFSWHR